MVKMGNEKVAGITLKYICECCKYKCSNKFNFDKHLATLKHKKTEMVMNGNELVNMGNKKVATKFVCLCGKEYNYIQGLSRHKKTCNYTKPICVEIKKPTEETGDVVALLMEQNKILMEQNKQQMQQMQQNKQKDKQMMELLAEKDKQNKQQVELLTNTIKDMIPKIGSNNNSNNTNQFNINMFLNEECKDAINMSDFIKSIQVSVEQLQYTTNNGLGKGLTKVIMDNMNKLSKYERPLHCSDIKRETIYIKDDDKWEKDTHKDKLKKAINKTSNKNYTALCDWTRENPAFMKQDDKQHFYAKTASTIGKPICDVDDKIITSICKDNFIKE
jgi:ribosomal protein L13